MSASSLQSPPSPFSPHNSANHSEPTSDELPDLGAFNTVLRAWTHLQPPPRVPHPVIPSSASESRTYGGETSSDTRHHDPVHTLPLPHSQSDTESYDFDRETMAGTLEDDEEDDLAAAAAAGLIPPPAEGSTVWNHRRIANYLESGSHASSSVTHPISEDEEEEEEEVIELQLQTHLQADEYEPSPPSPTDSTEGARTIEIASELDESLREDGDQDPSSEMVTPREVEVSVVSSSSITASRTRTRRQQLHPSAIPSSPAISYLHHLPRQSQSRPIPISNNPFPPSDTSRYLPDPRSRPRPHAHVHIPPRPYNNPETRLYDIFSPSNDSTLPEMGAEVEEMSMSMTVESTSMYMSLQEEGEEEEDEGGGYMYESQPREVPIRSDRGFLESTGSGGVRVLDDTTTTSALSVPPHHQPPQLSSAESTTLSLISYRLEESTPESSSSLRDIELVDDNSHSHSHFFTHTNTNTTTDPGPILLHHRPYNLPHVHPIARPSHPAPRMPHTHTGALSPSTSTTSVVVDPSNSDPSPIPSFDAQPDPVPDIDPSPSSMGSLVVAGAGAENGSGGGGGGGSSAGGSSDVTPTKTQTLPTHHQQHHQQQQHLHRPTGPNPILHSSTHGTAAVVDDPSPLPSLDFLPTLDSLSYTRNIHAQGQGHGRSHLSSNPPLLFPSNSIPVASSNNNNHNSTPHPLPHQPPSVVSYASHSLPSSSQHHLELADGDGDGDGDGGGEEPSLGYLDEALSFIAAERERWSALREGGAGAEDKEKEAWRHVIEPKRKRRRKRGAATPKSGADGAAVDASATASATVNHDDDLNENNEIENEFTSGTNVSPAKKKRKKKPTTFGGAKATPGDMPVSILKRPGGITYLAQQPGETDVNYRDGAKTPTQIHATRHTHTRTHSHSSSSEHPDVEDFDENDLDDEEEGEEDSRGRKAYNIHGSMVGGVYKSTPATPGTRTPRVRKRSALETQMQQLGGGGTVEDNDDDEGTVKGDGAPEKPDDVVGGKKRKKSRTKRKTLVHSRSVPQLKIDTTLPEHASSNNPSAITPPPVVVGKKAPKTKKFLSPAPLAPAPTSKRGRLEALARKLQAVFPEERVELEVILSKLANDGAIPNVDGKGKRRPRVDDDGELFRFGERSRRKVLVDGDDDDGADEEDATDEEDEEELDPRGREPTKLDPPIHIFIDHSNILIGLLSHLKRNPPPKRAISSKPLPPKSNANPQSPSVSVMKRPQPVPIPNAGGHPIPLPSFATANITPVSRSLPTGSVLSAYMGAREKEANSDGDGKSLTVAEKPKKPLRHLWHAALALILERGRAVSRRVIVTSSPLYQPMDGIERLGYEVRVYLRVPDLGDGMDRERHRDKDNNRNGLNRANSGKAALSSPVKSTSFNGWTGKGKGHARRISGSESGSGSGAGGGGAKTAPGGLSIATNADLHPYYTASHATTNNNSDNNSTTAAAIPVRIRYREQGVDELLQLKLHQALAATDAVPEGATIVLATGDGNVGQFNEDGFLGPVRTALRRGWKVELYAWEDGLSRSWRREFGEGSEWGQKGMFRIIGMEQFAGNLVEATGW